MVSLEATWEAVMRNLKYSFPFREEKWRLHRESGKSSFSQISVEAK
jgi:hypothetical protein